MSRKSNKKRLVSNEDIKETSNHTMILEDQQVDNELEQFRYQPAQSKQKQDVPKPKSSQKGSAQRSMFDYIQKKPAVQFEIEDVSVEEQIRIMKQIEERNNLAIHKLHISEPIKTIPQPPKVIEQPKVIEPPKVIEQPRPNPPRFTQSKAMPVLQKATQQVPKVQSSQPSGKKAKVQQQFGEGPLKGVTIVLSGIFTICSRDELEGKLRQFGAKVTGSISGKTNYLIIGEKLEDGRVSTEGNKYKEATKKGTKIVLEDELDDWLKMHVEQGLDDIFAQTNVGKLYKKSLQQAIQQPVQERDLFTDRYKPNSLDELAGNKGCVAQFVSWLERFMNPKAKQEKPQTGPKKFIKMQLGRFQASGDLNSKACIISGPPGIGKTTMVRLVAEAQGLTVITSNASDLRNKLSIKSMLNHLIDNTVLMNRFRAHRKFIILMDEVDGMTGSDRGGLQALIECIKDTIVPIVCICNDNESRKLQTFLTHCYPIKFQQPDAKQVGQRLEYVCKKENLQIGRADLEQIAACFDSDLRQSINFLQLMTYSKKQNTAGKFAKDQVSVLNTFNAVCALLNRDQRTKYKLREQMDLYFVDADMIPLIMQDSYINASCKDLNLIANAAELIAEGDIISHRVRIKQQWSLMPQMGLMSTIYPAHLVGEVMAFPKFPTWLGKNSTASKIKRETKLIKNCFSTTSYLCSAVKEMTKVLLLMLKAHFELKYSDNEKEAAWEIVGLLEQYNMNPDQLKQELIDITYNQNNPFTAVSTAMKSMVTKLYNKRHTVPKDKRKKRTQAVEKQIPDNYNPLIGEEAPMVEELPQEPQIEDEDEDDNQKKKQSKKQTKGKPRQQKQLKDTKDKQPKQRQNKKQQSDDDEDDLMGFIVDDEDDD